MRHLEILGWGECNLHVRWAGIMEVQRVNYDTQCNNITKMSPSQSLKPVNIPLCYLTNIVPYVCPSLLYSMLFYRQRRKYIPEQEKVLG